MVKFVSRLMDNKKFWIGWCFCFAIYELLWMTVLSKYSEYPFLHVICFFVQITALCLFTDLYIFERRLNKNLEILSNIAKKLQQEIKNSGG